MAWGGVGTRHRLGAAVPPWERPAHERRVAAVRVALGEEAFTAAWAAGAALPPEVIMAEAMSDESVTAPADDAPSARDPVAGGLTAREREVLALVAAGYTNKQIAEALFISASTVKYHVAVLLTKLDAATRAQLVTQAAGRGLLSR